MTENKPLTSFLLGYYGGWKLLVILLLIALIIFLGLAALVVLGLILNSI